MSLSHAMSYAASGLSVTSRTAQTISNNIANALTPGYAARETEISTGRIGGVQVSAINRRETQAILTERRTADAHAADAQARSQSLAKVVDAFGAADDPASLSARVANFAATLTEAASMPSSETRLAAVLEASRSLVTHVNDASAAIQSERLAADNGIADAVDDLNRGLQRVAQINRDITVQSATGGELNTLYDQRRAALDAIADLLPVREFPREGGAIGLMTESGRILVGDKVATVEFDRSPAMSPGMTMGAPLSGLSIDGKAIDVGSSSRGIGSGRISALFELRASQLTDAQTRLDAFSEDLVSRFQDSSTDPSLGAGMAGLFTDGGAPLSGAPAAGLSKRLALNPAVDPAQGGALHRLRDGVGAATAGPSGDASVLQSFLGAIDGSATPRNAVLGTTPQTLGGLADALIGTAAAAVFRAETDVAHTETRASVLRENELAEGVDTDDEMRKLLLVEQAYAANARVIQTAGSMLDKLLEL